MKRSLILLLLFLPFQFVKGIELQPYSGIRYTGEWGLQTGMDINFPLKNKLAIKTGLMLYVNDKSGPSASEHRIAFSIPVYASYQIPVSSSTKINLNLGPYVGAASLGQVGVAGKVGVEIKRIQINLDCFQNCITDKHTSLGLSVGYNFSLK